MQLGIAWRTLSQLVSPPQFAMSTEADSKQRGLHNLRLRSWRSAGRSKSACGRVSLQKSWTKRPKSGGSSAWSSSHRSPTRSSLSCSKRGGLKTGRLLALSECRVPWGPEEQRYTSAQLAWRQSEVNAQRDAQLRHQAISDRCLAISEELAVARAGFETERFQLEQDVGRLQAEIVTSASEANAVKLEARTMNTCHLPQVSVLRCSA